MIRGDIAIVVGSDRCRWSTRDLTLVPLLTALDDVGVGTVLAAPVGSDRQDGVVGVLRGSDVDGVVSSVDRLDTVNGVTVTVLGARRADLPAGSVTTAPERTSTVRPPTRLPRG